MPAKRFRPHPEEVWLLVARSAIQAKMPFEQCLEFADKTREAYRERFYPHPTPDEKEEAAK